MLTKISNVEKSVWSPLSVGILAATFLVLAAMGYGARSQEVDEVTEGSMPQELPKGYLAKPLEASGPGVLVLHAWWGLNDDVREACDKLAQEGFIAYAPDLYSGRVAQNKEEAEAAAGAIFQNVDQTRALVAEAVDSLAGQVDSSHDGLAVVGFSLGGFFALDVSNSKPDVVSAVVVYYATGAEDFSASKASYLGHFATDDEFEPESNVKHLEELLRNAGRPVTFHHYSGTTHWFAEASRPEAHETEAASLAWERTLQFLRQHLR